MKTCARKSSLSECGNTLIITCAILWLITSAMASYLVLVTVMNRSVIRSETWNAAIPIAEAGIEEAMAHLNHDCILNAPNSVTTADWTAGGWQTIGDQVYSKSNAFGSDGVYYVVTISNHISPVITSEGFLPAPRAVGSFAVIGIANNDSGTSTNKMSRKVRVTTQPASMFGGAMSAKGKIDMSGNNVKTDSFDSANPDYSTDGKYDPNKNKDNGDVATNLAITDSLNVGNANIWGHLAVGPGGGWSVGSQGAVGNKPWQLAGNHGVQPGYANDDMNVAFPDVKEPFTTAIPPGPGDVIVTNITAIASTNILTVWPGGVGPIYTNTVSITTNKAPAAGTYVGTIGTTVTTFYTNSYPGSGVSALVTNFVTITTNVIPSVYYSINGTNWSASTTSATLPGSGSYIPNSLVTNFTLWMTTATKPAANLYAGSVTTNYTNTTFLANKNDVPSNATNVRENPATPGNNDRLYEVPGAKGVASYSYYGVKDYTYNTEKDYTVTLIKDYSYSGINSYTYNKIVSYSLSATTYTTNTVSTHYDYILWGGNYMLTSELNGKVYVAGNATLYQKGNIKFSGNSDGITIAKDKTLKLYMAGASADIGGNGVVNGDKDSDGVGDGTADHFFYYGMPTNTELKFHGNAAFTGAIYAPNADFTLGGGGNDVHDFIGGSVTKTVKMNGHFNFQYS